MKTIAGHTFFGGPNGRECSCGRKWLDILDNRDRWQIGAMGIAHAGALNETEVLELEAEVERIWSTISGNPVPVSPHEQGLF